MRELTAADITKEVLLKFKAKGYTLWRNKNWTRAKRKNMVKEGISDVIGYNNKGVFIAVEVKTISDRLSQAQKEFLIDVKYCKGEAYVATQEGSEVVIKEYHEDIRP